MPQAWHIEPVMSSLFVAGAAIIMAVQNPINLAYQPRLIETLALVAAGVALLVWAILRHSHLLLLVGGGVLLFATAMGIATQPTQLNATVAAVWPLRVGLVLLITAAWVFLLQPPQWARRATLAFLLPTLAILLLLGGTATASSIFGTTARPRPSIHAIPYWLTIDTKGTLYASDLDGGVVWIFNSLGWPRGLLRPGLSPALPTPGPGTMPSGYESELGQTGMGLMITPTVAITSGGPPVRNALPHFDFCGMATDPQDNLYLIDFFDPAGYTILRFNREGNITARWQTPKDYQPTNDCLEADADHIYLNSVHGRVYVLNHQGEMLRQIPLPSQAFGISAPKRPSPGGPRLMATTHGRLWNIDVDTGAVITTTLTGEMSQMQIPFLLTSNNEALLTNHQEAKVVRLNASTGEVLGTIGGRGIWPGQFGEVGGLAEDYQGRIYVSDTGNRVIQRFDRDWKLNAVWWVDMLPGQTPPIQEEEEY